MNLKSRYKKASHRIHRRSVIKKFFYLSLFFIVPIITFVAIFFFLKADFLQIKEVVVVGNKDVSSEEIKELVWSSINQKKFVFIPKTNVAFYGKSELKDLILDNFKKIQNVDIEIKSFEVLNISIVERESEYIWCNEYMKCFLMDKNGLIFSEADNLTSHAKIIFRGKVEGDPILKQFDSQSMMGKYRATLDTLFSGSINVYSIISEFPNKVVFNTNFGDLYFNPEEDMVAQSRSILLLINEFKEKGDGTSFEYIDPRFGNKVYYKFKN